VATTVDVSAIDLPTVLPLIGLEQSATPVAINYDDLLPSPTNSLGLLLRSTGGKTLFWTEAHGLKSLDFTVREQDEAIIWAMHSAWYVIINDGSRLRFETAGEF
jgi:hypothetical protein